MPVEIYKPGIIQELEAYYGALLFDLRSYPVISEHLDAISLKLHEGLEYQIPALYIETNNYNPDLLGKDPELLKKQEFELNTCRQTIASEFGFATWHAVEALGNTEYSVAFEEAVNSLLSGNIRRLDELLDAKPGLVKQRSQYGHRATLLHYVASNGVEFWRQKVPMNLPEITKLLLRKGADIDATMNVYGGSYTTIQLLTSGAHPYNAGLGKEMEAVLQQG